MNILYIIWPTLLQARENRAKSRDVTLVEIIDSQNALQARVEHYWKGAIKDLENLQW